MNLDPPQLPLQPWQVEEPQGVPPYSGPIMWYAKRFPGQILGPDDRPQNVALTRVRIDHGHGRFCGIFAPDDLDRFADWCREQARLARTDIVIADDLSPFGNGQGGPR